METNKPDICIVCHNASPDMQFDEFLGGTICDDCDIKKEIRALNK